MKKDNKHFYSFTKRLFDILFSILLLIILLPLFIILSILVKITSKGPIFYLDNRLGKNKKILNVIKFRSMKLDSRSIEEILTEEQYKEYIKHFKLKDDPRTTKFGKFLRKTFLDELPQLLNILKGDMSFVGPRPIVNKEYEMYWRDNEAIFDVRPGLTGYWAVSGRSDIKEYQKRIDLECYYVSHRSIHLDVKILFKTIGVVFSGKGAL